MPQKTGPTKKNAPWHVATVLGGISGMIATTAVHPLDLIKVRLQLLSRYCTTREMARQIVRCRGYKALYAGLSAGLFRQTTNTTTRLGVYHALYNIHYRKYERYPVIYEKITIGITAGLAGALAGHPSEVILVRLMADGPLEPCIECSCPKMYKGIIHALQKICKEEGVRALWRGGTLTLGRSVLVSIGQIGSYSQVREKFREKKLAKGLSLHIYTSFVSSFLTAVFTLPIDLVKTRYQVKRRGIKLSEIFSDILERKGIWYFWKGFVPYYVRMAIHTTMSLLIFDKLYTKYVELHKV